MTMLILLFSILMSISGCGGGGEENIVIPPDSGDLDISFGVNGKITTTVGPESSAQDLAVQEDGKIVVAGSSWDNTNSQIALARYKADGNLDTSFGNGGTLTTPVGSSVTAKALGLQRDGKIVVAGASSDDIGLSYITLVRYNTDGSLDLAFGSNGKVITSMGIDSSAHNLVIQQDSKIVIAGHASLDIRSNIPLPVTGITSAVTVAAGDSHTCALLADATIKCWGRNSFGQLGDGTGSDSSTPTPVSGVSNVTAISTEGSHTCSRTFTGIFGTVRCWGKNASGQLGNGTTINALTPVQVQGFGFTSAATSITAGFSHTCTLLEGGTVQCWGKNNSGQLGNGTTINSSTPVAVSGFFNATSVKAGAFHTCALIEGNTVSCWGSNSFGQLGNNSVTSFSRTPMGVTGLTAATALAAGTTHTCALIAAGTVECWGDNSFGQLGDGTTTNSSTPVAITGISTATALAAGDGYTCALLGDGTVRCWGKNTSGQLGNRKVVSSSLPVVVTGINTAISVEAGKSHACVVLAGGTVNCWGDNTSGQLGNGTSGRTSFALARYLANGSLDPTFGNGGTVITSIGSSASANDLAIQPNGRIIAAGEAGGDIALVRYNPDGRLDPTFGVSGIVITDSIAGSSANALALQADNKIVVAGRFFGDFSVLRYNPDGRLDPTFGVNGKVTESSPSGGSGATALFVQADGTIVVVGVDSSAILPCDAEFLFEEVDLFGFVQQVFRGFIESDIVLVRYDAEGNHLTTNHSDMGGFGEDEALALSIQPDGKILVAGSASSKRRSGQVSCFFFCVCNSTNQEIIDTVLPTSFALARYWP